MSARPADWAVGAGQSRLEMKAQSSSAMLIRGRFFSATFMSATPIAEVSLGWKIMCSGSSPSPRAP